MRALAKKTSRILSPLIPLSWLISASKQNLFLPFYHVVSDSPLPHIQHLYDAPTSRKFRTDLELLLKHFKPVSLRDLTEYAQANKEFDEPSFHLTFDDGLRQCKEVIVPILLEYGIPATFFVNPNFVGNQALFYRYQVSALLSSISKEKGFETMRSEVLGYNYLDHEKLNALSEQCGFNTAAFLEEEKPYMTWEEIKRLQDQGFHIGAHSLDHPTYHLIPYEEQIRQTTESLKIIDEKVRPEIRSFAFPFTDDRVSKKFFDEMVGPSKECQISFGGAGLKQDVSRFHLQRFPMEKTLAAADLQVKSEYLYFLMKGIVGKNKILRH